MIRWSTWSMNSASMRVGFGSGLKAQGSRPGHRPSRFFVCVVAAGAVVGAAVHDAQADKFNREPMTLRVVAVNPSAEKTRTVPVRIDLPQEIKPVDILDKGELDVEFDTERSLYYVHKP